MIKNIIPTPKKVEKLNESILIPYAIRSDAWGEQCKTFATIFEKVFGYGLEFADGGIEFKKDDSIAPGAYVIDTRETAVVSASDAAGIFSSFASLILGVDVKADGMSFEKALIEDAPDKNYRSLMIDLARQWHPLRSVLHYMDICFMLKLNYIHLHFIDSQRYTLPSKAFPNINDKESYSYEDIKTINDYALERGITVVPEFEAPGHSYAVNRTYPEVFANELPDGKKYFINEKGTKVSIEDVMCPGKASTLEGIRTLLEEVCELFPNSPYIHIGGDEANISVWNHCPICQSYMEKNNIEDNRELYSKFVGDVARIVLSLGRTPIVWEGFPPKGVHHIPKETIVCAWESYYHLAPDLLEAGFKIINGSWKPLYIVPSYNLRWGPSEILSWNIYQWQHWVPHFPATLNPINVMPTEQLIGAQYSVWECCYEQEISRVIDNLPAFSERVWNVKRLLSDKDFLPRGHEVGMRIVPLIREK